MATRRTGITAPRRALLLAAAALCLVAAQATGAGAAEKAQPEKAAAQKGAVRTLEAINIDGEIAVPQVLFITARDVRRYRDGLGLKFQLSGIEAGRSAVLPSRLRVVSQSQSDKEEGK